MTAASPARTLARVPDATLAWLLEPENPAVAVLTRRTLLGLPDDAAAGALWARRNEYAPVAAILDAQHDDGSWAAPGRDYQKYGGSLWQVQFLGELWADGGDPRVERAAKYAFSRQLADGSWSCMPNMRPAGAIPCLTANVARSLARLGFARDERVARALAQIVGAHRDSGPLVCPPGGTTATLNGYCHMLAPKLLLLLGEMPRETWPDGAVQVLESSVAALRDRQVFRCLPKGSREFAESVYVAKASDRPAIRARYLAEHSPLEYGDKPGWLRFGYPLSYNSDALEALASLAGAGEVMRPEYEPAVAAVEAAADPQMRWTLRNTHNGKMLADVEAKGRPSKWLTLRALGVLEHFKRSRP